MKRLISTIIIAICTVCAFAQSINISFTGKTIHGHHVDMDSIVIRNLTQGWTATLVAPDTSCSFDLTAIKINSAMAAELSQNVPNPFYGSTEVNLALPKPDKVSMQALDMGGRVFANYNGTLPEGEHRFAVSLATPQGYLLSANTSDGTSSIKMVNLGSGGINKISYLGQLEGKALRDGDYDIVIGDELECLGYTTYCDSIYESELYTTTITDGSDTECQLRFNLRSGVTVDEITACGRYTWIDGHTYTESDSTATYTLRNSIGCDSVIRLDLTIYPSYLYPPQQQIIACDSYEWEGQTYTTSGVFRVVYQTVDGCDSTIMLNLGIIHPRTYETDTTVCDSYEWEGQTYTVDSTFSTTYQNQYGCDSIIAINFHVNHSTETIDTREECSSFVWIDGNTYTESNNEATFTYIAENGCDSVVRLNLTITRIEHEFDASACNSYWWGGQNYSQTGDYTRTYTAANGCDSVVTLHFTRLSNYIYDTIYACDSYTWIDGNTYTTETPTGLSYIRRVLSYTNSHGCDSTIEMRLFLQVNNVTDTHRACDSYTWIDGNTYTESNNTATVTYTNQYGCDSVVHLNLTIGHSDNTVHEVTAEECSYYRMSNGEYFTESGNYRRTLQTSCGCDSIVLLHLTITGEDGLEGTFYDERDNITYRTIQYGCQTWFAEDLRTSHFNDGTEIPHIIGNRYVFYKSEWGWSTDMVGVSGSHDRDYGYYYNINYRGRFCPEGWRLPTQSEWQELVNTMVAYGDYGCDDNGNAIKAMVSSSNWVESDIECTAGYNQETNNSRGLGLNPDGVISLYPDEPGVITSGGSMAVYLTTTSSIGIFSNNINYYVAVQHGYDPYSPYYNIYWGVHIRCIRDN
ncbi:MAG: hypothetical protein J6W06_06845 [Bacteroidales bacterium]|nr:hypothetical protein [Bacteroidales bacterium]